MISSIFQDIIPDCVVLCNQNGVFAIFVKRRKNILTQLADLDIIVIMIFIIVVERFLDWKLKIDSGIIYGPRG